MTQKTVCLDFDGVLAEYDGWNDGKIGEPLWEGVLLAEFLKVRGYKVTICTCRTHPEHGTQEQQIQAVTKWLAQYKVPYDHLEILGKPIADVYIDDKALKFNPLHGNRVGYASHMVELIRAEITSGGPD